jgi:benzoate/toluate 1,2-dioxygenase alpha subunit
MMTENHFNNLVLDEHDNFKVHRSVYTDPTIFEMEMTHIFEKSWVFLAHESQIKNPGDYYCTRIGRQPIFLIRLSDGSIAAHLNACSHRGATLMPYESGNTKAIRCRFHGWTFHPNGHCMVIKNEATGEYPSSMRKEAFGLTPLAALQSYRGFVFGALNSDLPALEEWLGASKDWIDCLVDQSIHGLEVIKGASTYVIEGNWKLQAENGVDGYHVSTVHRVFASTIENRERKKILDGFKQTEAGRITGQVPSGSFDFGHGHMGIWTERTKPEAHPIWSEKDRIEHDFSPAKATWMIHRTRNLYLFPNAFLMDNPSTQIRTMVPISPNRCEVTVRCIAPVGESQAARSARLRKFEDFYLTTGMATSDDLAALEAVHQGSHAIHAPWNVLSRGSKAVRKNGEGELLMSNEAPSASTSNWDHEVLYHGFYRHWKHLIQKGLKT